MGAYRRLPETSRSGGSFMMNENGHDDDGAANSGTQPKPHEPWPPKWPPPRTKPKYRTPRIEGQFAPRKIDMLESPAFRALSLSGHRVLARLEIELAHHGGQDNGKLPCTFDDFEEYGIHRHAVAPAIRECEALGFIEITDHGRAGNREFRSPNKFRLTYRNLGRANPTDEWRRIKTLQEAEAIARTARKPVPIPRPKKQNSSGGKRQTLVAETATTGCKFYSAESATTAIVRKPPLLSISRAQGRDVGATGGAACRTAAEGPTPRAGPSGPASERRGERGSK
jgi:hypothetical protein